MGRARKHVMYLFVVQKWQEDYADVVAAMYAVRARSSADCADVLCDRFYVTGKTQESRDERELIKKQVAVSKKARLFYRYSTSQVFDHMIYGG